MDKKRMNCVHDIALEIAFFERANLISGRHTSFLLQQCTKCHKFTGFPRLNFIIALNEGTEETLRKLVKKMTGSDDGNPDEAFTVRAIFGSTHSIKRTLKYLKAQQP